ncbi:SnoaL-like domain-containing protein [Amycolatopsis arida]|uniref:SnoaL-like domain-containing protein n=1 Tax=Amycolatopsis arida TaxID=587909 RepID=A0A1I6ALM2_9PSEU|nr:nuclear transport factor 2 family protein [Amycolatopsis arida]TDX87376.1 SnoaL-like protein [Amycolatopsis arida]SFQ69530.1 SnoaL-like domain-containing protein [Amycolatopsis arida]
MTDDGRLASLAERYGAAWNAHDLDAIMALHTERTTFRLHLLGAPDVVGRDAVRAAFAGLLGVWPDIHFRPERLSFGAGLVVHQCVISGTLAAPMPFGAWVAQPTGERIQFTGVDVITVADGLVHRKDTYLDIAAAQHQLGLFDEPAAAAG